MTATSNQSAPATTGPAAVAAPLVGYVTFVLAMFSGEYFGINLDSDRAGQEYTVADAFSESLGEYGIGLVGLAIGIIVAANAWRATPERLSKSSLVLGILGLITVMAFWSGWPLVFGATAVGLAYESYRRVGSAGAAAWIGLVAGATAFIAATVICVTG